MEGRACPCSEVFNHWRDGGSFDLCLLLPSPFDLPLYLSRVRPFVVPLPRHSHVATRGRPCGGLAGVPLDPKHATRPPAAAATTSARHFRVYARGPLPLAVPTGCVTLTGSRAAPAQAKQNVCRRARVFCPLPGEANLWALAHEAHARAPLRHTARWGVTCCLPAWRIQQRQNGMSTLAHREETGSPRFEGSPPADGIPFKGNPPLLSDRNPAHSDDLTLADRCSSPPQLIQVFSELGVEGLLVEYEDMFPYGGELQLLQATAQPAYRWDAPEWSTRTVHQTLWTFRPDRDMFWFPPALWRSIFLFFTLTNHLITTI